MIRIPLTVLTLGSLLLAGCVQPPEEDVGSAESVETEAQVESSLPEPLEVQETVTGGLDPLNFLTDEICTTPGHKCSKHGFTLERAAILSANLEWMHPVSDFDLYLYQGNQRLAASFESVPVTEEAIRMDLPPGDYELVVVPWAVAQDTFTLKVTFS